MGINIGQLTKFGGVVGAATLAGKEFKAIIDSNQTSADSFTNTMSALKTSFSELNYALGTFDFTNFKNGLSDLIERGREAAAAIDQLDNTLGSYSVKQAKIEKEIARLKVISVDKNSTPAEKAQALLDIDALKAQAKAAGEVVFDVYTDAIVSEFKARGGIMSEGEGLDLIDRWLEMNAEKGKDAAQEYAKNQYDAYKKAISDLDKAHTISNYNPSITGGGWTTTVNKNEEYYEELKKINNQYKDAIGYNTILEKLTDEQRHNMENMRVSQLKMETQVYNDQYQAQRTANKIGKSMSSGSTSTTTQTESENKITRQYYDTLPKLPDIQGQAVAGLTPKKTISNLQNLVSMYRALRDELEEGDPMIDSYNQRMQELEVTISNMQNSGIGVVEMTNTFDDFTSAMSNVSTIVSSLTNTFKEGAEITAASILSMVSTALPAIASLISSISALTAVEAVEAGVGATAKAVSTSKHWIEAIAAVAALGGVVAAAISSAKNAGSYATGGIIGGNSFVGDRLTANVNSGEMILNRTQQANLFRQINNGTGSNQVTFHISGTELVGVLNNNNRKNRSIR